MLKKLMLLVTLFLLLSACTPVVDTPTPAPIAMNTSTPTTVLNTSTPQPTQTDLPPALTNTPAATPVLQPVTNVTVRYVNNLDELPGLSGKLAFRGVESAYLYDLSSLDKIFLGDLFWHVYFYDSFSPDREMMLMIDRKGQDYLVDSDGNITQQLIQISQNSEIVGFLDNDRLIVVEDWNNKDYYGLEFTTLMNIYSNEIVPLEPLYPDFGTLATNWGNNLAIYHPQLPLVVYPAVKNKLSTINLFDLEKQQVLAEIPAIIEKTERPQWSPDGKYLLLSGVLYNTDPDIHEEIYLVDTEGRSVFKTLFGNQKYKEVFAGFSWSPDSQRIAFWIRGVGAKDEQLAILDINSGIVTQYDQFATYGYVSWSPDSQFVAVEQVLEDILNRKITILNLDSGTAYKYFETKSGGLSLAGWVK